ncbi:MAG: hypothetical protein PVG35_06355 [Desulfobacterales bacterium]|jgi:hypothetical protein
MPGRHKTPAFGSEPAITERTQTLKTLIVNTGASDPQKKRDSDGV